MSKKRWWVGLLATFLLAAASGTAIAAPAASESEAARLVFLLEYVGADYGGAVQEGQVVDELEYGEMLRFTKHLIREYEARFDGSDAVAAGLRHLLRLIEDRAPADAVRRASRDLLPAFSRAVGADVKLAALPNLASGARLWSSDCALCHGPTGQGDGPVSAELQPPPTPFSDLDGLSPRRVYGAVSFGVEDTAMPSFVPAYSERQRWDVAFYAMTLRNRFNPVAPPGDVRISLDEIAASSNAELLARLGQLIPEPTSSHVDYLRANFPPPAAAGTAADPNQRAAGALGTALALQDAFVAVADRVYPRVVGVLSYGPDPSPSPSAGKPEVGGWTAAAAAAPKYPGFRPLRSGSGFVVSDDGYVLSRDDLVRDERGALAQFVSLELDDGTDLLGRIVGAEPALDLAVLRFADPPASLSLTAEPEIADSDRLTAGHWIIALGDPPGVERTLAVGVVSSGPARQCYQEQLSATLIQSSMAIPPGGLGGPVVDISGRIVGVAVDPSRPDKPPSEASPPSRILPINLAMNLYEALRVAESRQSPWIGISVLERQSPRARKQFASQAAPSSGVYIDDVFEPSAASRAGIRIGDLLLELGGHGLGSVSDFQTWMYVLGAGKQCELKLLRDGKPLTVKVTIEPRPATATTS